MNTTSFPNGAHNNASTARARRAAIAQRLIAQAPDCVDALHWDALDRAPDWLALSDAALLRLRSRVGAVMCASALRLWIDGARIGAARAAVGDNFLRQLLAQPAMPANPLDVAAQPRIDVAGQVGSLLQIAGAAVLLASLPHGSLRRAVCAAFEPAVPATIGPDHARSLLTQTQSIAASCDIELRNAA